MYKLSFIIKFGLSDGISKEIIQILYCLMPYFKNEIFLLFVLFTEDLKNFIIIIEWDHYYNCMVSTSHLYTHNCPYGVYLYEYSTGGIRISYQWY